jgi:hypothetical protein
MALAQTQLVRQIPTVPPGCGVDAGSHHDRAALCIARLHSSSDGWRPAPSPRRLPPLGGRQVTNSARAAQYSTLSAVDAIKGNGFEPHWIAFAGSNGRHHAYRKFAQETIGVRWARKGDGRLYFAPRFVADAAHKGDGIGIEI